MSFSEILIDLRKEYGLSQKQLADKVGVSQSTIAKLEISRNEATASTLTKLAQFFNVTSDYMLGLENEIGAPKYYVPTQKETNKKNPLDELSPDEQKIITQYRDLKLGYKNLAQKQIQTIWDYQQNEMTQIDSHKKKTPKTS